MLQYIVPATTLVNSPRGESLSVCCRGEKGLTGDDGDGVLDRLDGDNDKPNDILEAADTGDMGDPRLNSTGLPRDLGADSLPKVFPSRSTENVNMLLCFWECGSKSS